MTQRCTEILPSDARSGTPVGVVILAHDERHLRRKLLHLKNDDMVMLDLKEPVMLAHGDRLLLDNGECVEVIAADEKLYDIRPRDAAHLVELAWHLGNRHLPAEFAGNRILIQRDPVIRAMLEGLGAAIEEVTEPFHPLRGAYHAPSGRHGGHSHGHSHSHGHEHPHKHD